MAPSTDKLKTSFGVSSKIEPFFTGGKIQVSKDGDYLLCQCGDRIQVVATETGKVVHNLLQEEDEVISFVLGPDNVTVVTSHKSSLLRHWTWREQGNVVRTWKSLHLTPIVSLSFDITTTLLASGGTDGSLKVWDIQKQYCTHNLKGGTGVYSLVKFHPDPNALLLYGASMDGVIRCWDLTTSDIKAKLEGHYSTVTDMVFFLSLNRAVTCGRDKVLILWDLETNVSLRTVPIYESIESMTAIALGKPFPCLNIVQSHNPHVITAGEKGNLRVWDVSNSKEVFTQSDSLVSETGVEGAPAITQLLFNKHTNSLYVVTFDHNIIVHQMDNLSLLKQYTGYNDDILDIAWFGDKETHLAVATNSHHIKVYEIATMNCILVKGHTDLVLALATSKADQNLLISSSKDNTVRVWSLSRSPFRISCIAKGTGHTGSVGAIALSRISVSFLVSGSQDTCVKMWKMDKSLAERDTEQQLMVNHTVIAHDKDINAVCISPNDKLIATASQDKTAKVWSSTDLKLLGVLRGHKRGLWAIQFSPSDQVLASASADASIKLWSLTDYSCIKTLEGHESSVLRFHFVAKGQQLVSAASDGLIKLWTLKSSECVSTLDAHEGKIWALAVNGDDSLMASGAGDATLIMWRDTTQQERETAAQEKEKRLLEEQQLSNLLHQGLLYEALRLAIDLNQPFRTLNIIKELMDRGETEHDNLFKVISELPTELKDSLVRYASMWNTNSRYCHQAQMVLHILLKTHTPDEVLSLASVRSSISGLLLYTERHMQRLNRLKQNSAVLPYTASRIQATSIELMDTD